MSYLEYVYSVCLLFLRAFCWHLVKRTLIFIFKKICKSRKVLLLDPANCKVMYLMGNRDGCWCKLPRDEKWQELLRIKS